jgi:hypothetical protein
VIPWQIGGESNDRIEEDAEFQYEIATVAKANYLITSIINITVRSMRYAIVGCQM